MRCSSWSLPLALFALLILPVAMAVQLLVRRQFRRLAEAAATGVLAVVLTAVANDLLTRPAASRLYDAIIMARPGTSHAAALDPYLAGLVAYATMVGLAGLPYWRNALWAAIAVYAIVHVGALHTTVLTLLITVIGGRAIGLAVRYAAGSASQRPGALDIAGALAAAGLPVTAIRRVRRQEPRQGNPSRHYAVTTNGDGGRLDVVVYDRDQQAAGAVYRLYRRVRVRGQVSRNAPLSVEHAVERRALLSYAAEDAGAPTPRLRALVRAGPEASVLAYDHHDGTTLAQRNAGCSDAELSQIWDAVGRLHARKVTHRGLTADRILLTDDGQAMLLDPGDGDVEASDLQIRLDVAQLLAELALVVGPDRAADLAVAKMSADDLVAVVSLLQPVALARPTRKALRRRRDVLPALRTRLLAAVPGREVEPVQLERIRPRTLLTLVASVAAVYLLAGELERASLGSVLHKADWRWGIAALALSAAHLRRRHGGADRVRPRAAELPPHPARPAGQLLRHAGDPRRRRRGHAEHQVPAAPEDLRGGRGGQRGRIPGGRVRPARPADPRVRRDRRQLGQRTGPPAAVDLVRAGRPRPHRARGAGHPRRAADAARPPVADAGAGAAAAARGRAAAGQARPRRRRHAAAEPVLHLLPGRLRGGVRPVGADRENRPWCT